MPFGTITVNTVAYSPRLPGVYVKSSNSFSDPANEFRIKGASKSKDQIFRASIVRLLEKDIGSPSVRRQANIALALTVPVGFLSSEVDLMVSDISEFITSDTLTRILAGES